MRKEDALKYFEEQQDYFDLKVNSGIELNRKAYAMLSFVNEKGEPLKDITFKAKQKTHDFNFGCNMFVLDEFESEEKNEIYRKQFAKVFNYGTAAFYWKDLEPEKGKPRYSKGSPKIYRRPAPDLVVEYCRQNNIKIKGHCLFYDGFSPKWLPRDKKLLEAENERHIIEIAERYSADIHDWDITNETLSWSPYYSTTAMYRDPDYIPKCFALADKYLPHERKFINECYGIWDTFNFCNSAFYLQLENLMLKGVNFDCIGLQHHQFVPREKEAQYASARYNPKRVFEVLDTFGKFNKPIQLSEVTIASYNGDNKDMEIQARLLENSYKMWFSHKNVDGIVYWNLVDGYTYNQAGGGKLDLTTGENQYGGGLLYHDLSPKPAFETLDRLINSEWHTEGEYTTIPGTNNAKFKGFKGMYDIEFDYNGKHYKREIHVSDSDFDDFAADSTTVIKI